MSLADSIKQHYQTRGKIYEALAAKNIHLPDGQYPYLSCIPELISNLSGWMGPGDPNYHCIIKFKIEYDESLTTQEIDAIKNLINSTNKPQVEIKFNNTLDYYHFDLETLNSDSDDNTYFITIPTTTEGIIRLILPAITINNQLIKYGTPVVLHTFVPETQITLTLTIKKLVGEVIFYERLQIKDAIDSSVSYLRKKIYNNDGSKSVFFGYYEELSQGVTPTWVDQSQIRMSYGKVLSNGDIVKEYCDSKGAESYDDYEDFHETLKNDFGMHSVDVIVKTKDENVINKFIQINKFSTRTYTEDVEFITVTNGNPTTIVKKCIVTSITPTTDLTIPHLAGYHIHSAFNTYKRTSDGYNIIENDYAYLPCYRASTKNVKTLDNIDIKILVSQTGSKQNSDAPALAIFRSEDIQYCRNNNLFEIDIVDSKLNKTTTLQANTDDRRFCAYTTFDNDLQNLINYICFGIDPTVYFTSRAQGSYELGQTSVLLNNDYYFGKFETSGMPILECGVEDSNWASNGAILHNATYENIIFGNTIDEVSGNWLVALDRNDIRPDYNNIDLLIANGYQRLNYSIKNGITNRRQGYDNRDALRDFYFPTNDNDSDNITVASTDGFLTKNTDLQNIWLTDLSNDSTLNIYNKLDSNTTDKGNYYGSIFNLSSYLDKNGSQIELRNNANFSIIVYTPNDGTTQQSPVYLMLYKFINIGNMQYLATSINSDENTLNSTMVFDFENINLTDPSEQYVVVFKSSAEQTDVNSNIVSCRVTVVSGDTSNGIISLNSGNISSNSTVTAKISIVNNNLNTPTHIKNRKNKVCYTVINSDSNYTGSGSGPWCKDCDDYLNTIISSGYKIDWWSTLLSFNPTI